MNAEIDRLREAIIASERTDPDAITKDLLHVITPSGRDALFPELLRRFVSDTLSHHVRVLVPAVNVPGARRADRVTTWLDHARIPIGHVWFRLRELTAAQLLEAAADRRQHAADTIARAEALEKLAALMEEAGAPTVGDMPEEVVVEVLK